MAAWLGLSLNCAACWGWRNDGRHLLRGAALASVEGLHMKTSDTTKAVSSAPNRPNFTGTDNPRHLRVIHAFLARPRRREDVDNIAGCSNAPELIAELRRRGLDVPCERVTFIDRDGCPCRPGVYSLTASDRRKIFLWLAKCGKGRNGERSQ